MWGSVQDRSAWLQRAIIFTGNHAEYGHYMRRVIEEWPVSCENALTDYNLNRKAWIGHAACALALNCPEDITRKAWGFLSNEQRVLANKEAARAIQIWEDNCAKGSPLRRGMERRCYFNDIPDEVSHLIQASNRAPSWKAIAMAILRNDHNLHSLGFQTIEPKIFWELIEMGKEPDKQMKLPLGKKSD